MVVMLALRWVVLKVGQKEWLMVDVLVEQKGLRTVVRLEKSLVGKKADHWVYSLV